jgi:hypothetical protein
MRWSDGRPHDESLAGCETVSIQPRPSHGWPPRRANGFRPVLYVGFTATWRSGYAAACKAVYTGSIPVVASNEKYLQNGTFRALAAPQKRRKRPTLPKLSPTWAFARFIRSLPAQSSTSASQSSVAGELGRLAELHEQGRLSDEEFQAAKRKTLG